MTSNKYIYVFLIIAVIIIALFYTYKDDIKIRKSVSIARAIINQNVSSNVVTSDSNGDLSTVPITDVIVPYGSIIMWSGNMDNIPIGWAFCDGNNGTPDLRGRFVLCANPENNANNGRWKHWPGETGGNEFVLANHTHRYWDTKFSENSKYASGYDILDASNNKPGHNKFDRDNSLMGTYETTKEPNIQTTDNDTRPPFFVLAYIMKI